VTMHRRALVVDDEPAVCQLIHDVMNSVGMNVLALTKSAEAASYLRDEKFDVVLLDIRMPAPDGIEVARQTRGSGFNRMTPIIMISDDQNLSAVMEGFDAGANFFLYKPIDKGRLLHLIRATRGAIKHEQRRFRRIQHRATVRLTSDKMQVHGETIDISLNGMLVEAGRCLASGSQVEVNLELSPGSKPIVGAATVMRTMGEKQMGLEFSGLNKIESSRLQEFLLSLIEKD
jgi:DNA-binding response OmpR family regulator